MQCFGYLLYTAKLVKCLKTSLFFQKSKHSLIVTVSVSVFNCLFDSCIFFYFDYLAVTRLIGK